MELKTQEPTQILAEPLAEDFRSKANSRLRQLQLIILIILGPVLLIVWWRLKLGIWWPDVQLISHFWSVPAWIFSFQFLVGWGLGWLMMRLDQLKSQVWYQSQPLTRSISFCLVLLGLGVFMMTSTASWLGIALVLSLWSQLMAEILIWQADEAILAEVFLHDVKSTTRLALARKLTGRWGYLMIAGLLVLIILGLL